MKCLSLVCFFIWHLPLSGLEDSSRYEVIFYLGEDCKICQYYTPTMNTLSETFANDSISFTGLFPSRHSTEQGIKEFREKYQLNFELRREYFGSSAKAYGVTLTPEVVIYDNQDELVLYRGRIDNSYYKLGRRRRVVDEHELQAALVAIIDGDQIMTTQTPAIGCFITFR